MATYLQCLCGIFFAILHCIIHSTATCHVYIVYLGVKESQNPNLTSKFHLQLLSTVFSSQEDAKKSLIYSYNHSFSGFSAKLNSMQARALSGTDGVISIFRSKKVKLHTTRSWDFMGLTLEDEGVTPLQLAYGDDVVVAIFDSGIWPESASFQEYPGIRPIPSSWKGTCVSGENFDPTKACNKKLIGARYYYKGFEEQFGSLNTSGNPEYRSARDFLGHGTHTASTTVGSISQNASFLGFGKGVARGGAPKARLAIYKTCWGKNFDGVCSEADILAAFDDALNDGVNVISASFGLAPPLPSFFASTADIGSFHAMQMGVSVVFSAGNEGPYPSLVSNVAPWATCVAASQIDRTFPTQIVIDNNIHIMGEGLITTQIQSTLASANDLFVAGVCELDNWRSVSASGRVVLCFSPPDMSITSELAQAAVKHANGTALLYVEPLTRQIADVDIIPTIRLDLYQGTKIKQYMAQSHRRPRILISPSKTEIGKSPAPSVVYFSSRGPSSLSPDFLKPDISAPGTNILAAWPPNTSPSFFPGDKRSVDWNFLSGTSMACPHVSGVVGLIKSAHPDWSPAAIRSALITTAYNRDTTHDKILAGGSMEVSDPFDIGAGHINPLKAINPGLVYDMNPNDYTFFLCNIGYAPHLIKRMLVPSPKTRISCPKDFSDNTNLNYPSITVSNLKSSTTIRRTVRNVGERKNAVYFASITGPDGVEVIVWPRVLIFSVFKKENTYYATLKPSKISKGRYDFGEIVWSDGLHHVRSPLVVFVNNTDSCGDSKSHAII